MSNLKKTSYVFIALAIALLLAAISISVAFNFNKAYADYDDLMNDPNSVVNFNQLYNGVSTLYASYCTFDNSTYSITFTSTPSSYGTLAIMNSINLTSGHKYYFACKNGDLRFGVSNVRVIQPNTIYTADGTYSYLNQIHIKDDTTIVGGTTCYLIFVDLTQMFGDNLPTLEDCQSLFVANYYSYSTGTPLALSNLNAYSQALSDLYSSSQYALDMSALGISTFAVNYNNANGFFYYDTDTQYWFFTNTFGVPLFATMQSGTIVEIEYSFYPGNQSDYHLQVMLFDGVNYSSVAVDPNSIGDVGSPNKFSFTLPTAASVLYFNVVDFSNDRVVLTNYSSYVGVFNIKASIYDVGALARSSYSSGYSEAADYYNSYFSVGGTGYNSIYNAGKTAGINENNPYTFGYLMSSVIEAPLNAVLDIFNFDFLGYNFKNFITVMITLCFIIAIVRMFMGGKE